MNRLSHFLVALLLGSLPTLALAQGAANFPNKSIRIVVGFGPGGPTDIFGRLYASHLERKYKQPIIVDNRPGAGQLVGADLVAKSAPDGYTLMASTNTLGFESLLNKDSPLDTTKDILPFGIIAGSGLFIGVHSSLPVKNMAEFIAWVRANPGKLNVGTAGAPVSEFEGLRDKMGLNWVNVNYKGGAAAMTALMAGEVHMYTPDLNQGLAGVKEGRVRLLSYSEGQRHLGAPDVPTVAESGIGATDFRMQIWLGMFAPPGVPADIINKLNADVNEMAAAQDAFSRINAMGWRTIPSNVETIRKNLVATNEQIAALLAKGVKLR